MSILVPYGKTWQELNRLPTLEHELFFSFLLISPSYQKVHRIRVGKEAGPIPKELIDVNDFYDKVGNVFGVSFDEWWKNGVSEIFYGAIQKVVTVNLDTSKPRSELIAEVNELLDSIEEKSCQQKSRVNFLANKIRVETLNERYWLIVYKSYQIFYNKKIENWRLGAFLASFQNVKANWAKELKGENKATAKNLEARERIGQLVSKMAREALYIAENAARGKFPSKDPIKNIDFDYLRTYQFTLKHQFKYLSMRDQLIQKKELPLTERKWIKEYKVKNKNIK